MTKEDRARERQWQAEEDARVMARYQEIMADKARTTRAIKEAKKQANELEKRTSIMKKVVKQKNKK